MFCGLFYSMMGLEEPDSTVALIDRSRHPGCLRALAEIIVYLLHFT